MKLINNFSKVVKGLAFGAMLTVPVFLTSCNDETLESVFDGDAEIAVDEGEAEAIFEDSDDIGSLAVELTDGSTGGRSMMRPDDRRFDCAEVTIDGDKTAGTITIDFGDGCVGPNGRNRKGVIKITYSGARRFLPGFTAITTFENFSIDDVQVEGTRTVTNTSESTDESPKFNITLVGGQLTWPDGSTATREVNKTREWVRAAIPANDSLIVNGTASGVTRGGNNYGVVNNDIMFRRFCRWPVSGTKVVTTDNRVITIDFGDGECDRRATVTVNGQSEEVNL